MATRKRNGRAPPGRHPQSLKIQEWRPWLSGTYAGKARALIAAIGDWPVSGGGPRKTLN